MRKGDLNVLLQPQCLETFNLAHLLPARRVRAISSTAGAAVSSMDSNTHYTGDGLCVQEQALAQA